MDELDLISALSDHPKTVQEYLKTAGLLDSAKGYANLALESVKKDPKPAIAALLGALGLSAITYRAYKPGPSGKSKDQEQTKMIRKAIKTKPDSFSDQVGSTISQNAQNLSNLLSKHPGKAALMAAPIGASTAYSVAKRIFKK